MSEHKRALRDVAPALYTCPECKRQTRPVVDETTGRTRFYYVHGFRSATTLNESTLITRVAVCSPACVKGAVADMAQAMIVDGHKDIAIQAGVLVASRKESAAAEAEASSAPASPLVVLASEKVH